MIEDENRAMRHSDLSARASGSVAKRPVATSRTARHSDWSDIQHWQILQASWVVFVCEGASNGQAAKVLGRIPLPEGTRFACFSCEKSPS